MRIGAFLMVAKSSKPTILIIVENLRLGGIQRLAMDEAYWFQNNDVKTTLVSLQSIKTGTSILDADGDYFSLQNVNLLEAPMGRIRQMIFVLKLIRVDKPKVVLCHAARANVYIRLASLITLQKSKCRIIGFIHQLPNMSSFYQNLKRAIYFRFADEVWAVSKQFMLEINHLRSIKKVYKYVFRSDIGYERVGIFHPRLEFMQSQANEILSRENMPPLFLGRMINWKGFSRFTQIVRKNYANSDVMVFTSPEYHADTFDSSFFTENKKRLLLYSKGIGLYLWPKSAVHFYPTKYAEGTKHPVSISMNVLECAALGIPSIISEENFESYPELRNSLLCQTTDWTDTDVERIVEKLKSKTPIDFKEESMKIKMCISIDQHCSKLKEDFLIESH